MQVLVAVVLTMCFDSICGKKLLNSKKSKLEKAAHQEENQGNPLFITPYLKRREIFKAQELSKNPSFLNDRVKSYSGFLTVNESAGMNMFFWFFPAEFPTGDEPVMVWLQGGPGASSMFGALIENGPYQLTASGELSRRQYNWNKNVSMLYIDNPAGVGYSFSDPGTIPTDQEQVGHYLYSAVQQFLQLFPNLRQHPFYVSGESYGGKYVPALAYAVHKYNRYPEYPRIDLVGIAIGNPLLDPVNMMMVYPEHQYNLGLIDDIERLDMEKRCRRIVREINAGNWYEASERFREMFWNSKTQPPHLLQNNTGFTFHYNILADRDDGMTKATKQFMSRPVTKKALHVGNLPFHDGSLAEDALHDDMMKSVMPWFVQLVEHYDVLLFSGQLDIILPHVTTVSFLKKMRWSGANAYRTARKKIWRIGRQVAGYSKTVWHSKNGHKLHFTDLLVRSAGHIVPQDQPEFAFDMINHFIFNANQETSRVKATK